MYAFYWWVLHVDEYFLLFSVVLSTNLVVLFTNHLLFYYSSPKTSEDAHEYMTRMRDWLLEELQPSSAISHTTKDGSAYDAQLHNSMKTFWDLFDKGEYVQKLTCKKCNTTFEETKEAFSEVVLQLPPSHQEGDHHTCTLDELIRHHNETAELDSYQCSICNTRTIASSERMISQYPKIMCIVLSCKKSNETKINLKIKFQK